MLAKKIRLMGVFIIISMLMLMASSVHAAPAGVGVVDINRVVSEVNAGQRAQADIKQRFDSLTAEIGKLGEELQTLQQNYQKQVSMMTPEARAQKEQELEAKLRVFNERRMAAQKEIAEAEKTALDPIIEKLKVILQNIGKQRNLAMILDLRTVPYFDSSVDLTSEVVGIYNKANP